MSDNWVATRWGYVPMDADDEPTEDERFAELLADIWKAAVPQERIAIARERGALGIRNKAPRSLTETEQAVLDYEIEYQCQMEADWPVPDDLPF